MNIQRGMTGDAVSKIESRLKELQLYSGAIDGSFGGGTEAGIKNFQIQQQLPPTGIVDPETWGRLFPGVPPPQPALASATVGERCLALTGTFETGAQPPDWAEYSPAAAGRDDREPRGCLPVDLP